MKWYTIQEEYLRLLRHYESRIPNTDYGDEKFKPFFGSLFEIGDLVYLTQVSHPRGRHFNLKEDKDFIKLYDGKRLIAVVNLNYMFPVHKSKLIEVEYRNIDRFRFFENEIKKNAYITLLKKEMKEIKNRKIKEKSVLLYKHKYDYPLDRVSVRCFDFKDLEKKSLEFAVLKEINEAQEAAAVHIDPELQSLKLQRPKTAKSLVFCPW